MRGFFIAQNKNNIYRGFCSFLACVLSISLVLTPSASHAQSVLNLPIPGTMIAPSPAFVPVLLKGMTIHPDDPLKFDFIIDSGNTNFNSDEIKEESERLVKYFLASMTVPKDDLWVNLSPYEQDRIIPEELGKTELGRDMLAQDYILKQLTASLMYPEEELGKKFWDKVYAKAEEQFGTREIPVNTFNKVWILPESATVYEHEQTVYIVNAHLKVMLDSDYMAMEAQQADAATPRASARGQAKQDESLELQSSIIKEIIIPEIEKEINEGQHFAPLRQIYHSLILAKWYKETVKNSLLSQIYVDQNKIAGVESGDKTIKDQIYSQYIEAYKKGVFNYIKEDYDRLSKEVIPRKYFSGGEFLRDINVEPESSLVAIREEVSKGDHLLSVNMMPQKDGSSSTDQSSSPITRNEAYSQLEEYLGYVPEGTYIGRDEEGNEVEKDNVNFLLDYWEFPDRYESLVRDPRLAHYMDVAADLILEIYGRDGSSIIGGGAPINSERVVIQSEIIGEQSEIDFWKMNTGQLHSFAESVRNRAQRLTWPVKEFLANVNQDKFKWDEASQEFLPVRFDGLSIIDDMGIIQGASQGNELIDALNAQFNLERDIFRSKNNRLAGLSGKLAPLPESSFHVTIKDGVAVDFEAYERVRPVVEQTINDVLTNLPSQFARLASNEKIGIKIIGVDAFPGLIKFHIEIVDKKDKELFEEFRTYVMNRIALEIRGQLGDELADKYLNEYPPNKFSFNPHISIAYIADQMDEEEVNELHNALARINGRFKPIYTKLSLGRNMGFTDMVNFFNLDSQSGASSPVLGINDPKSNNVDLVGGKAASLKELGSIPGISVPAGFNVTTKVYEDYLVDIGANYYITQLEGVSGRWKASEENDPGRQDLRKEMFGLAIKIHDLILEGKIPTATRKLILTSYKKLEKDGQPALVAVRSSATAEDMPDASFAGQYTTYLNIQGEDKLIEAIKGVWASTYYDKEKGNMNPVEYRNKHNLRHSKNKMGALILEMVNPQSAGTAFTVDLETGAPFISINNSYGLGEAEVAGLVTSDTWIVDPDTNEIIKRRLGEKEIKIVYDQDKKRNVNVSTSELERKRFAISQVMAKEIALLVKRIQDHYVRKNPNLNHMDIEYAVTNDGRIVFTQARPETVWAKGIKSLIAIDAKEIDALNKKAQKAGEQMPYPEIFKGGVSGSTGVARGILRVVATVAEAEEYVKPGDIMVAPNTTNAWEPVMGRASGIITEIGGPGNHTAVVSREQGKAAIVAAVGAMQSLKMYEGQLVTIDATSKKVYLNDVSQDYEFMPDKIKPEYGGLFSQTLDESWNEAQETMTTAQAPGGTRWINKPNQKVRKFLQEIFTRSHHYVAEEILGITIRDRINVDEENKNVGVYQVDFDTIYPWMTETAAKPLEGPNSLSSIHEARVANIRDFLKKSENLILTKASINEWLDSFVELNAYMGYAYNFYRITEGLLEDALKRKQVPEPYLSQVWLSMAAWVGETEAIKRNRDYGELLEDLKDDNELRKELNNAVDAGNGFDLFAAAYPEFYSKLDTHAFNYKIMKNTDDIFSSEPFHALLVKELLRDAADNRTIGIYDTKPEQFYPEDPEFTRIARLSFFASKLRQDAHHFKVRGQWKFVEVLRPLADFLIERGDIQNFGNIFDHTPEWILEKVAEYEKSGKPVVETKTPFHIKKYEIQDLNVTDEASSPVRGSLTAMGRWKFESANWDKDTNKLKLVNATRIENVVKPEFLKADHHAPRDIVLSTRTLSAEEQKKIEKILKVLGTDHKTIVVIKLDRTSAFNRIYGLYANGISFIREDILSEGNENEIHEALDHLRLKPTDFGYEELKNIQYYGNLRDLITRLSHRTIKKKLIFDIYGEEEAQRIFERATDESLKHAIRSHILEVLGEKQKHYSDDLAHFDDNNEFYDKVTREMVRNKADFKRALSIVAAASSPIESNEEVGGIDLNEINVNHQGSGIDIQFDPVEVQEIIDMGIDGFAPVIINLTPLPSILPLLGLEPQREEEFEVSRLN